MAKSMGVCGISSFAAGYFCYILHENAVLVLREWSGVGITVAWTRGQAK